jgi:hypothetical protein
VPIIFAGSAIAFGSAWLLAGLSLGAPLSGWAVEFELEATGVDGLASLLEVEGVELLTAADSSFLQPAGIKASSAIINIRSLLILIIVLLYSD